MNTNQEVAFATGTIKAEERFLKQGIKAIGWNDPIHSICEFIDNLIDGGATEANIEWRRRYDKTYDFLINDNGCGVPQGDMENCFATYGTTTDYDSYNIGNFGVGATAGITVLAMDSINEKASVRSVYQNGVGNLETGITFDLSDGLEFKVLKKKKTKERTGITIQINGIRSNLTPERLIKRLGVIYYPHSVRAEQANSEFKLSVNQKRVEFEDPFYRELEKSEHDIQINEETIQVSVTDKNGNQQDHDVHITTTLFGKDFPLGNTVDDKGKPIPSLAEKWDKDNKGTNKLPRGNRGVYTRCGGKYIVAGGDFPLLDGEKLPATNNSDDLNQIRIEIQIPRDYMEAAGVSVDKNIIHWDQINAAKILETIGKKVRLLLKSYHAKSQSVNKKSHEELADKLTRYLNGKLMGKSRGLLQKGVLTQIEDNKTIKRKKHKKDPNGKGIKPKDTKIIREGSHRGKRTVNTTLIEFESLGENGKRYRFIVHSYDGDNETYQFSIGLNRDHPWIESVFLKATQEVQYSMVLDAYARADAYCKNLVQLDQDDLDEQIDVFNDTVSDLLDWESKTFRDLIKNR